MILDAQIPIFCDYCDDEILYMMPWKYTDYSGDNGYYDSNEYDIKKFLKSEDWVIDDEKTFCCDECHKFYKEKEK